MENILPTLEVASALIICHFRISLRLRVFLVVVASVI